MDGQAMFKFYGAADVLAFLPKDCQPAKSKFEELIRTSGCYRDIFGKVVMLESDVVDFFNWLRAAPSEASARTGAGGLLRGAPPAPNSVGHIVVIAAHTGVFGDDMMFLGWAPVGGVQDLVERVQFGCSFDVAVKNWRPGTPAQLAAFEAGYENERYRGGWFMPTHKLRKDLEAFMATQDTKDDTDEQRTEAEDRTGEEVGHQELGGDDQY